MARSLIMHVDEAPWLAGRASPSEARQYGYQLIGDVEQGPWLYIVSFEAGRVVAPHTHSRDEVIFIIEGELTMGGRVCGPGTVVFLEQGTEYGFAAGRKGVRFLNIRPGPAQTKFREEVSPTKR